jgi:hypothetical protein
MADDKPAKVAAPATPEPYVPDEAGSDPDTRMRLAKQQLAAAETAGDDEAADKARADLDKARRDVAAAARGAAAQESGDEEAAKSKPPAERQQPAKQTTAPAKKHTT